MFGEMLVSPCEVIPHWLIELNNVSVKGNARHCLHFGGEILYSGRGKRNVIH